METLERPRLRDNDLVEIVGALQPHPSGQVLVLQDRISKPKFFVDPREINAKSKWSYSRLVLGRQVADETYKELKEIIKNNGEKYKKDLKDHHGDHKKLALTKLFDKALNEEPSEPLQILLCGEKIKCIASSKIHSLITRDEVRGIIREVFMKEGIRHHLIPQIQKNAPITLGVVNTEVKTEFGDWKVGLAIHTGDILTNRAIKIGSYYRY